jgi:hypothetical protein
MARVSVGGKLHYGRRVVGLILWESRHRHHHIPSHHTTPHPPTSPHTTPHHIPSHHTTPHHITPHHTTPHHITVTTWHGKTNLITFQYSVNGACVGRRKTALWPQSGGSYSVGVEASAPPHPLTPHHTTSPHIPSHHTTPHPLTPHHTTSHHTTPHHTTPHHCNNLAR